MCAGKWLGESNQFDYSTTVYQYCRILGSGFDMKAKIISYLVLRQKRKTPKSGDFGV